MAKSSSKFILAGIAGLASGLAIGMLIAPRKGSKTRKRLKKKFKEIEDALQQGNLSEKIENLKSIFRNTEDSDNRDTSP
jgi:gas vesicle protein